MRSRMLMGGALAALVLAFAGMILGWPRSTPVATTFSAASHDRTEFGPGVLTTTNRRQAVSVSAQAARITVGPHSVLDTTASRFTLAAVAGREITVVPNARLIGSASFDIALDSRRWFTVRVGDVLLATTGARFSARFDVGQPSTTSVSVAEGEVVIQPVTALGASAANDSADSQGALDITAGTVAWWSGSARPNIVSSINVDHYSGGTSGGTPSQ